MDLQDTVSEHFRWYEVVQSAEALRAGIDNTNPPPDVLRRIFQTAESMDKVWLLLNAGAKERVAVNPTSWFRCEELERRICDRSYRNWCKRIGAAVDDVSWKTYFNAKSHPRGEAVDFQAPRFGPPRAVFDAIRASPIVYDQLIIEFDAWVHVSFTMEKPRMDAFMINNSGRVSV